MPLQLSLHDALQYHQSGQWDQAEAIYHQMLHSQSECADAWHLLGDIALRRDDVQRAMVLILRAIAAKPKVPAYYVTMGKAYQASGDLNQAVACLERALTLKRLHSRPANETLELVPLPEAKRLAWR